MRVTPFELRLGVPLGACSWTAAPNIRWRLTCHCLLLEMPTGLVLVDTGYGLRNVENPRSRLNSVFLALLKPELRAEITAHHQIRALGFDPRDVRHIVLTHLDFDHAGGLDELPAAQVHMLARERDAAFARTTTLDRMRDRPAQWSTSDHWSTYPMGGGEPWFGFDCVRELVGIGPDIALVPLVSHTLGHAGVAVKRDENWLFMTGDAYFYRGEIDPSRPRCTPGLSAYQTMMGKDRTARLWNQRMLCDLARSPPAEVRVVCAHDVVEFERGAQRTFDLPAGMPAPRVAPPSGVDVLPHAAS